MAVGTETSQLEVSLQGQEAIWVDTCAGGSHPFRTPEALTLESRALMWHLAGWG